MGAMRTYIEQFWIHLEKLLRFPLIQTGEQSLTVGRVLFLILLILLVFAAEALLRRQLIRRILSRTHLSPSLQYAVARFTGYGIVALGLYISLKMVGIDLSSLALVAGAVSVGIGFGLQNIIHNFVSGLIILAERPIAIGDRVEVEGVAGRVSEINLRSTTVVTNDIISIIVPNSAFVSGKVINWSHGDPKVRIRIPVGVAYGSNPDHVRRVLLRVAAEHPTVLRDPAPQVFFDSFGDSALNFELAVWTAEMVTAPRRFRSDLNFAIARALREEGIEIPFPQRDLHLRSGSLTLSGPGGSTQLRIGPVTDPETTGSAPGRATA